MGRGGGTLKDRAGGQLRGDMGNPQKENSNFNQTAAINELEDLSDLAAQSTLRTSHYVGTRAKNLAKVLSQVDIGPAERDHVQTAILFLGAQIRQPDALSRAEQIKARLDLPEWVPPEYSVLINRWEQLAARLRSFPTGQRALEMITEGKQIRQAALHSIPRSGEPPHKIFSAINLAEAMLASSSNPAVARASDFLEEKTKQIQKLASISNRSAPPDHILIHSDKRWMYHWALGPFGGTGGGTLGWVSENGTLGSGRISAVVIEEGEDGSINLSEIFRCALHEGIHLNQHPYQGEASDPPDWPSFEAEQLLEGMTEGLAILRCRSEENESLRDVFRPRRMLPNGEVAVGEDIIKDSFYTQEVAAVFTVLEKAGVRYNEISATLEELQALPLPQAVDRLKEMLGEDPLPLFRQALQRWETPVYAEDTPNSRKWQLKELRKKLSYISKVFQKQD